MEMSEMNVQEAHLLPPPSRRRIMRPGAGVNTRIRRVPIEPIEQPQLPIAIQPSPCIRRQKKSSGRPTTLFIYTLLLMLIQASLIQATVHATTAPTNTRLRSPPIHSIQTFSTVIPDPVEREIDASQCGSGCGSHTHCLGLFIWDTNTNGYRQSDARCACDSGWTNFGALRTHELNETISCGINLSALYFLHSLWLCIATIAFIYSCWKLSQSISVIRFNFGKKLSKVVEDRLNGENAATNLAVALQAAMQQQPDSSRLGIDKSTAVQRMRRERSKSGVWASSDLVFNGNSSMVSPGSLILNNNTGITSLRSRARTHTKPSFVTNGLNPQQPQTPLPYNRRANVSSMRVHGTHSRGASLNDVGQLMTPSDQVDFDAVFRALKADPDDPSKEVKSAAPLSRRMQNVTRPGAILSPHTSGAPSPATQTPNNEREDIPIMPDLVIAPQPPQSAILIHQHYPGEDKQLTAEDFDESEMETKHPTTTVQQQLSPPAPTSATSSDILSPSGSVVETISSPTNPTSLVQATNEEKSPHKPQSSSRTSLTIETKRSSITIVPASRDSSSKTRVQIRLTPGLTSTTPSETPPMTPLQINTTQPPLPPPPPPNPPIIPAPDSAHRTNPSTSHHVSAKDLANELEALSPEPSSFLPNRSNRLSIDSVGGDDVSAIVPRKIEFDHVSIGGAPDGRFESTNNTRLPTGPISPTNELSQTELPILLNRYNSETVVVGSTQRFELEKMDLNGSIDFGASMGTTVFVHRNAQHFDLSGLDQSPSNVRRSLATDPTSPPSEVELDKRISLNLPHATSSEPPTASLANSARASTSSSSNSMILIPNRKQSSITIRPQSRDNSTHLTPTTPFLSLQPQQPISMMTLNEVHNRSSTSSSASPIGGGGSNRQSDSSILVTADVNQQTLPSTPVVPIQQPPADSPSSSRARNNNPISLQTNLLNVITVEPQISPRGSRRLAESPRNMQHHSPRGFDDPAIQNRIHRPNLQTSNSNAGPPATAHHTREPSINANHRRRNSNSSPASTPRRISFDRPGASAVTVENVVPNPRKLVQRGSSEDGNTSTKVISLPTTPPPVETSPNASDGGATTDGTVSPPRRNDRNSLERTHPILGTPANIMDKPAWVLGLNSQRIEKKRFPDPNDLGPNLASLRNQHLANITAGVHAASNAQPPIGNSVLGGVGMGELVGVGVGGPALIQPATRVHTISPATNVSIFSTKFAIECAKHISFQYSLGSLLLTALQIAHICVQLRSESDSYSPFSSSIPKVIGEDDFLTISYILGLVIFGIISHLFFGSHLKLAYSMLTLRGATQQHFVPQSDGHSRPRGSNSTSRSDKANKPKPTNGQPSRGSGLSIATGPLPPSSQPASARQSKSAAGMIPESPNPATDKPKPILRAHPSSFDRATSPVTPRLNNLLFSNLTPEREGFLIKVYMGIHCCLVTGLMLVIVGAPGSHSNHDIDSFYLITFLGASIMIVHFGVFSAIFSTSLQSLLTASTASLNLKQFSERKSVLFRLQVLIWSTRLVHLVTCGITIALMTNPVRSDAGAYLLPMLSFLLMILLLTGLWSLNWQVKPTTLNRTSSTMQPPNTGGVGQSSVPIGGVVEGAAFPRASGSSGLTMVNGLNDAPIHGLSSFRLLKTKQTPFLNEGRQNLALLDHHAQIDSFKARHQQVEPTSGERRPSLSESINDSKHPFN